ncbi:MAG: DNA polymerase III subunit gamma/tau [Flavobacteriaceae bacterium]
MEAPEIVQSPATPSTENAKPPEVTSVEPNKTQPIEASAPAIVSQQPTPAAAPLASEQNSAPKVSALSLASIKAKREMQQNSQAVVKEAAQLPTEPFTETDMRLYWTKYANKLGEKGYKIMESLLTINDPVLNGTHITIELPNEGSKIDFESEKNGLLGYLRGHLHNHDITIEVIVNEAIENKFAFTPQDKYNRLNEINPNLELLRRTFDLDF